MLVYRIGSRRYAANDGSGAALYGGRWNQTGTPMIYAAASRALCALEILSSSRELANDYISIPIEVPSVILLKVLSIQDLPDGWNSNPHPASTRELGTAWATSKETAILVVPSAVLPRECNYLINPLHADFLRITFHTAEPFAFGERIIGRGLIWKPSSL